MYLLRCCRWAPSMLVDCACVADATPATAIGGNLEQAKFIAEMKWYSLWTLFTQLNVFTYGMLGPAELSLIAVAGVAPEFFDHWFRRLGAHLQPVSVVPLIAIEQHWLGSVFAQMLQVGAALDYAVCSCGRRNTCNGDWCIGCSSHWSLKSPQTCPPHASAGGSRFRQKENYSASVIL